LVREPALPGVGPTPEPTAGGKRTHRQESGANCTSKHFEVFAGAILADCHFATALMPRPLLVLAKSPVPRPPCREALPIVSRGSSSRKQEGRGPRTIDLSHPASQHDAHSSRETPPDAEYQARLLHLLGFGNWLRMCDDGPSWFRGVRRRFQFFYLSIAA